MIKKHRLFGLLLSIALICSQSFAFSAKDFYESNKKNSPDSPNNFETQEMIGNTFSETEVNASETKNFNALKDENIVDTIPEDERKASKHYIDVQDLEASKMGQTPDSLTERLKQLAMGRLGGLATSTQRANCFVARAQSFYQYQCKRTGVIYGGDKDNGRSPNDVKEECQRNCTTDSKCVKVIPDIPPLPSIDFGTVVLRDDNRSASFGTSSNNASPQRKIEYLTFNYSADFDFKMEFYYTNKNKERKNPAKGLVFAKTNGKVVSKRFKVKDFVNDYGLTFSVEAPNGEKVKGEVLITDLILDVGKSESWVCLGKDISGKSGANKMCNPNDIIFYSTEKGERVEICRSQTYGDNPDGSYSDEASCQSQCVQDGECSPITPPLNTSTFFGFIEGCMTGNQNCNDKKCVEARENLAPIINEWVYDAQGNRTQTIQNGIPIHGVVRPRIIASQGVDYNEKIQEEGKELSRVNMIKNQTYVYTKNLGEHRETSYAYSVENGVLQLKIKPSDTLYEQPAYIYVIAQAISSTPEWKIKRSRREDEPSLGGNKVGEGFDSHGNKIIYEETPYTTAFYYAVDEGGDFYPFYRLDNEGDASRAKGSYKTFQDNSWRTIEKKLKAPSFKTINYVADAIIENKYYIKIPFMETNIIGSKPSGIPYKRAFDISASEENNSDFVSGEHNSSSVDSSGSSNSNGNSSNVVETVEQMRKRLYNWDSPYFVKEIYSPEEFEKSKKEDVKIRLVIGGYETVPKYTYGAGDALFLNQIYVIASDKPLSYEEIMDKIANGDNDNYVNPHSVWNDVGFTKDMKSVLKSDKAFTKEGYDIYLAGRLDNLSAYATFTTLLEHRSKPAYFFYWTGDLNKRDSEEGSIKNLEPNSLKYRDYINVLLSTYNEYNIFEGLDLRDDANKVLYFGYGTGDFDDDKDCKIMYDPEKNQNIKVCLPWWKIEREYDAKEVEDITDAGIKSMFDNVVVPLEGKKVEVCSKIDPFANAIFNQGEKTVSCTSYYSRTIDDDCNDNPKQSKCFVTTCSDRVKNYCRLEHTYEFANGITSAVKDVNANGNASIDMQETRVDVKGYTYTCPETANLTPNHICLDTQTVVMNPANCNDDDEITSEQKENLKSGWIYCDNQKPTYDVMGNVTGFLGKCPNGKTVTCSVNVLKSTTKTCIAPVYEEIIKKEVITKTIGRTCQEVYVDISKGEVDKYKDQPNCIRINSADDSRGGTHEVTFSADGKIPTLKISALKTDGTEDNIFCIATGNNPKMAGCKQNNVAGEFFIGSEARYKVSGSSEIIFVERAGRVEQGDDISGIEDGDTFDIYHDFQWETKDEDRNKGWFLGNGRWLNEDFNNISTRSLSGGAWKLPRQYHRGSSLNFFSKEMTISTKGEKIFIVPEVSGYNFQFLTNKCTKGREWHCHHYDWDMMCHYACEMGARGLPDKENFWADGGRRHIEYGSERGLKVFSNALTGLTILFPSASHYTLEFKTRSGGTIKKHEIYEKDFQAVGQLNNIALGTDLITREGIVLRDELIPQKEKEVADMEEWIRDMTPIKKGITTYSYDTSCPRKGKAETCECPRGGKLTGDKNCPNDRPKHWGHPKYYHGWCKGSNVGNDSTQIGWADRMGSATFCLGRYNKNAGIDSGGYNVIIDCNYDKKLETLKQELADLKEKLRQEKPRTCSDDRFSPVGGGTHFGLPSDGSGRSCETAQPLERIRSNAITSIRITDNETGEVFNKTLTFPLPYINNIQYTNLKNVERRKYKCCQDF